MARILEQAAQDRQRDEATKKKAAHDARSLYSPDGLPTLRLSFALYLDELGTREKAAELTDEDLRAYLRDLTDLRWFLHDELRDTADQRFLSFSDNVVLGAPWSQAFDEGGLFSHVFSAAAYQLNLAVRGRLLRGGLTLGPLYIDDRVAMGPALAEAVVLEEEVAVYPRVVLSRDAAAIAYVDMHGTNDEGPLREPAWNKVLAVDADGRTFLHYLAILDQDDWEDVPRGLTDHRAVVTAGLRHFPSPSRVREKYLWLAWYHNYACAEFGVDDSVIEEGIDAVEDLHPRLFRQFGAEPSTA